MDTRRESNQPSLESFLHGGLGTVFAVAVVVMAFWSHVQTLVI